jgi:hypothetical protein
MQVPSRVTTGGDPVGMPNQVIPAIWWPVPKVLRRAPPRFGLRGQSIYVALIPGHGHPA